MIDRRTFLKLSAGALVLTAAGALTGCGTTIDLDHPKQEVEGVMFLCDITGKIDFSGGGKSGKVQYKPYFAIWNRSKEDVSIPRKDITGIFTEKGYKPEKMVFIPSWPEVDLEVGTNQYQVFSRFEFGLETENGSHENNTQLSRENGTYEVHIKYKGKTVVFIYDGKTMTSRVE